MKNKTYFVDFGAKCVLTVEEVDMSMELRKAKIFLGSNLFNKAMMEWDIETLDRYASHPEAILFGASEAFDAIINFKKKRAA